MTATIDQVLSVEHHELGYVEGGGPDGHSGNVTKYWAEMDPSCQHQPWCMCFQRWSDKHAGGPLLPVSAPWYCPSYVTYAKQHGLWIAAAQLTPGDYYFCDFGGHGIAEHVGRCVVNHPASRVVTGYEGNTTAPNGSGSQANGGGVYERQRGYDVVMGGLDYSKLLAHAASNGGVAPRHPVKHNPFHPPTPVVKQGARGDGVRYVQWAVGAPVDGVFGPTTDHAVRQFQHYHGLHVDGLVGHDTLAALAKITH